MFWSFLRLVNKEVITSFEGTQDIAVRSVCYNRTITLWLAFFFNYVPTALYTVFSREEGKLVLTDADVLPGY